MKVLEKFKDILKEEDLNEIKAAFDVLLAEKVEAKVATETDKIQLAADEKVATQVSKKVEAETAKLVVEYDKKMKNLETHLVEKIDQFIDSEISENISEETLKGVAVNEAYKPVIEGIMRLFEEKFVALDVEGHGILREAKEEIESLEEKLSTIISEKMDLKSDLDETKAATLITGKTKDLTETQIERVKTFFEGKSFEDVDGKIDSFVELVQETEEIVTEDDSDKSDDDKLNEDITSDEDGIDDTKEKKKDNLTDRANNLL